MKNLFAVLLFGIGLVLNACHDSSETVSNKPVIKSISFAGIPDNYVTLDEKNSTITVQIPSILPGGLKPELQLTQEANVIRGITSDKTVDLSSYCVCGKKQQELELVIGNNTTTTNYRLIVIPSKGAIKPQSIADPVSFSRQTKLLSMSLPVENLYTNPSVDNLVFTNVITGKSARIYADGACLNTCKSDAVNQLQFNLHSPIERDLVPGTYSIAIGTNNGVINFPQRLIVTE